TLTSNVQTFSSEFTDKNVAGAKDKNRVVTKGMMTLSIALRTSFNPRRPRRTLLRSKRWVGRWLKADGSQLFAIIKFHTSYYGEFHGRGTQHHRRITAQRR